jgi:hypothetical protein
MASAQEGETGSAGPRWSVRVETFLPMDIDTTVRFDVAGNPGAPVSYESELGLDDEVSQFRGRLAVRLGGTRRHEVELVYLTTERDNLQVIDESIDLGEIVIPPGAEVFASAESQDFELNYKYYFLLSETGELGFIVGAHLLQYETVVGTSFEIPDVDLIVRTGVISDETAPVPLIGLMGDWEFAPKWHLNGSFKWIDAKYDVWDGFFIELQAAVEHQTWKHGGFGIGYSFDDLDVKEDEDPDAVFLGDWEQRRQGFILYFRGRF